MKQIFSLFSTVILLFTLCINVTATDRSSNTYIEYFNDGSYITTTISEVSSISVYSSNSKSGTKTTTYTGSDGDVKWEATLRGTFTYNGTSATCTSSSITHSSKDSNWKITSATASKTNNKAIGDITAKQYAFGIPMDTVNITIILTCSANGTLS